MDSSRFFKREEKKTFKKVKEENEKNLDKWRRGKVSPTDKASEITGGIGTSGGSRDVHSIIESIGTPEESKDAQPTIEEAKQLFRSFNDWFEHNRPYGPDKGILKDLPKSDFEKITDETMQSYLKNRSLITETIRLNEDMSDTTDAAQHEAALTFPNMKGIAEEHKNILKKVYELRNEREAFQRQIKELRNAKKWFDRLTGILRKENSSEDIQGYLAKGRKIKEKIDTKITKKDKRVREIETLLRLKPEVKRLTDSLKEVKNELSSKEEKLKESEKKLKESTDSLKEVKNELSSKEETMVKLSAAFRDEIKRKVAVDKDLKNADEEKTQLTSANRQLTQDYEKLKTDKSLVFQTLQQEKQELEKKIEGLEKELQDQNNKSEQKKQKLEIEKQELEKKIEDLNKKLEAQKNPSKGQSILGRLLKGSSKPDNRENEPSLERQTSDRSNSQESQEHKRQASKSSETSDYMALSPKDFTPKDFSVGTPQQTLYDLAAKNFKEQMEQTWKSLHPDNTEQFEKIMEETGNLYYEDNSLSNLMELLENAQKLNQEAWSKRLILKREKEKQEWDDKGKPNFEKEKKGLFGEQKYIEAQQKIVRNNPHKINQLERLIEGLDKSDKAKYLLDINNLSQAKTEATKVLQELDNSVNPKELDLNRIPKDFPEDFDQEILGNKKKLFIEQRIQKLTESFDKIRNKYGSDIVKIADKFADNHPDVLVLKVQSKDAEIAALKIYTTMESELRDIWKRNGYDDKISQYYTQREKEIEKALKGIELTTREMYGGERMTRPFNSRLQLNDSDTKIEEKIDLRFKDHIMLTSFLNKLEFKTKKLQKNLESPKSYEDQLKTNGRLQKSCELEIKKNREELMQALKEKSSQGSDSQRQNPGMSPGSVDGNQLFFNMSPTTLDTGTSSKGKTPEHQ